MKGSTEGSSQEGSRALQISAGESEAQAEGSGVDAQESEVAGGDSKQDALTRSNSELEDRYAPFRSNEVMNRFYEIVDRYQTEENPAFGSDSSVLKVNVCSPGSTHEPEVSTISWDKYHSELWTEPHVDRSVSLDKLADGTDKMDEDVLNLDFHTYMMPWEQWQSGLEYEESGEGDKWTQARGIAFPKLDLDTDKPQVRLFLLLPSLGGHSSPIRGRLIVSVLYLHSCYNVVRHSRGNPAYRGKIIVDDRPVDTTKNLELFLRHIRHPTKFRVLYIRELCINTQNESEKEQIWTGEYHALVEDCSCGILEMNHAMELLDEQGYIPDPERSRGKSWFHVSKEPGQEPWHMPMFLKRYPSPRWEGGDDAWVRSLEPYEYVPLDIAAREIRVLGVYPAEDPNEPIFAEVFHIPLRANFQYHALSYAWGSSQKTRYIRDSLTKIAVTENLYHALHQFRCLIPDSSGPYLLWTDGVCIDQGSSTEKERYIPRIHDIYEAAICVLVSLGPLGSIAQAGRDLLKHVAHESFEVKDQASSDAWAGLYNILRSSYFSRRWVIQELASASAPCIMFNSSHHLRALQTAMRAAMWMYSHFDDILNMWNKQQHKIMQEYPELRKAVGPRLAVNSFAWHQSIQPFQQVKKLHFIRQLRADQIEPSFLFLLISSQSTQCADPRDIIYSIWNISRERHAVDLRFSYHVSVRDCFINFTRSFISSTRSLDLICVSQCPAKGRSLIPWMDLGYDLDLDLPSWCPDYRQDDLVSSLIRRVFMHLRGDDHEGMLNIDTASYHADTIEVDASCSVNIKFSGELLIVQGIILDTISFASSKPYRNTPLHDFNFVRLKWFEEARISTALDVKAGEDDNEDGITPSSTRVENTRLGEFMSMATGEPTGTIQAFERGPIMDGQPSIASHWRLADRSPFSDSMDYFSRAGFVIKGRRFIRTSKGHIGLAPWHVQEGYKLAIICGCSVPVLLEYVEEGSSDDSSSAENEETTHGPTIHGGRGRWYFRGDCFVQDWMEGQMMKQYGDTTEEAWATLGGPEHRLFIG